MNADNTPVRREYAATPAAAPPHMGQATAVEQSRAIAQVQAAVVMARQFPRSEQKAIAQMRDACGRTELANRAFFSFPRAGEKVTGASVYLARELARIWGNIDYGLNELVRDDEHGQSEMQAYAWDLETNARSTRTFIVQHARDTKRDGRKKLTELRDISDNNANLGSRVVREMIFAVLPQWFTDMAQTACRETMNNGGGHPLPVRIDNAISAYAKARISRDQLEDHIGRPVEDWSHTDVSDLEILFGSLSRKEITRDEAFPPKPVTADELADQSAQARPARQQPQQRRTVKAKPAPEPAGEDVPEGVNPATGEVLDTEQYAPSDAQGEDPWADQDGAA